MIIETAQGFANVREIAAGSPRLQAMSLGAADFAASMGMQTTGIGGTQDGYYMLPPARRRRARAALRRPLARGHRRHRRRLPRHGLLPVDGPFGDFSDPDGFTAQARRSATLGMVGKWAIHPSQVALANAGLHPRRGARSPRPARSSPPCSEAEARGQGAATYKGRLIDLASVRQAQVIVRMAELIAG